MLYTIDNILTSVVGHYISSKGRVDIKNLINARSYSDIFTSFLSWVNSQYELGYSVSLGPLGVIVQSSNTNNIGTTNRSIHKKSNTTPTFVFFRSFVEQYQLNPKTCLVVEDDDVTSVKMNASVLAKANGVDTEVVKLAIGHIFQLIGEV